MDVPAAPVPAGLDGCDREPIHAPGHIQPQGVLIATEAGGQCISHVSVNAGGLLGLQPAAMLGIELADVFGAAAVAAMEQSLGDAEYAPTNVLTLALPVPLRPRRKLSAHRWQGRLFVELEDAPPDGLAGASLSRAQHIIVSLRRAETIPALLEATVREVCRLTGFDRVMVYRFDAAGHGSVIAEEKAAGLPAYLNLHYPATDIPTQARKLYLRQRVRAVRDVDDQPVPLVSSEAEALDMSFCALRAMSPVHCEYLRNMGVRASFSISILQDETLWGLIVCHHMCPRALTADLRALCDVIGHLVSMLLRRLTETEALAGRLARGSSIAALRQSIDEANDVVGGLSSTPDVLLRLMDAGGALIRHGGQTRLLGDTPPEAAACAMVDTLLHRQDGPVAASGDAGLPDGVAAPFAATASGILAARLPDAPGDVVAWFRPEVTRTVLWGGDPNKPASDGPRRSPRASFAAWSELRRGSSAPWTATDLVAAEDLCRTITQALLSQATLQLAHLGTHDVLTGLANRRTLEAQIRRWQLAGTLDCAALLFIDLDRFKTINDAHGHAVGDECLIEVAERLRQAAPQTAVAARLGGDEFVLFYPGTTHQEAEAIAEAVVQALARPFLIQGEAYHAGASVGVACAGIAECGAMLRRADAAMYAAKRNGGGQAAVYQPERHAPMLTAMQTEQDLFRAIDADELLVYYQPIVSIAGRAICGFEALARWRHPVRGWVSPAEFIPIAEAAGLISRIGAWVLAEAATRLAGWSRLQPGLTMSVNVSPRQLADRSLIKALPGVLAATGAPPGALCLEVTESVLMVDASVRALEALRALGVTVAVDDFGTGHSSLAYLRELPVDIVKIDRRFVSPLGQATPDRFFTAIIDLARTLELRTVAEGCETWEQWRVIEAAGCGAVQGWLVAPAMSPEAAEALLRAPPAWVRTRSSAPSPDLPAADGREFARGMTITGAGLQGRDVFFAAVRLSRMAMAIADPHQPDMPLVFVNESFEQLTGYPAAEILGRNCRFLQGADTDCATVRRLQDAIATRQEVSVELINYRKDGSSFWNALRVTPVFDAAGRLVYFFGSQVDVTRRKWS